MAFKTNKILPCPEGHSGCIWENQGGWHRCYCPICHTAAQIEKREHKKWQRKVTTHSQAIRDTRAQQQERLHNGDSESVAKNT